MKRVMTVLLVVILLLGGLSGYVYANSNGHEPLKGDKLVGFGPFGTANYTHFDREFRLACIITNPDCVGTITIDKISIINSTNGTLIYEGPLRENTWVKLVCPPPPCGNMTSIIVPELGPHESGAISLGRYFPRVGGPHNPTKWMSPGMAQRQDGATYTVEVFWSAEGWNAPLIGKVITMRSRYDKQGNLTADSASDFPMWNMKQRLDDD